MEFDDDTQERAIASSWADNAEPWCRAIDNGDIASRVAVTNGAVVSAVLAGSPRTVLDIGCGEGWLLRALAESGVEGLGMDSCENLIHTASQNGAARYVAWSYQQLACEGLPSGFANRKFDCAVCNFSLFGNRSVQALLESIPRFLSVDGRLVIQTLHPFAAVSAGEYCDGWREGSWQGFGEAFTNPAPWYFRTLSSWLSLLHASGFQLVALREPQIAGAVAPASLIIIAEPA